ncbi:MAG: phage major capsid protein [Patescibacteria group bacterium]
MSKFAHMTQEEITNYIRSLESELTTCTRARMAEIDQEITLANEALARGEYRADPGALGSQRRQAGSVGRLQILASYGLRTADPGAAAPADPADIERRFKEYGERLLNRQPVEFGPVEMAEARAILVASGSVVTGAAASPQIAPTRPEVSSLVDLVNAPSLVGAESYSKPFLISSGTGDYTAEGENYTETDAQFGKAQINKAKITAYTTYSEELKKLSPANYAAEVFNAARTAVRKKLAQQIMLGSGNPNTLTGIFNAPATAIPLASDIEISAIDADTLDKIVFGYGGDEDVEGGAYLILSKADLAAFAAIRGDDGKKLYTITLNGAIGTISSDGSYAVPFVLNSACPALSAESTDLNTYCMAYGAPKNYEMPLFSQLEVVESTDFLFRQGLIAVKACVFAGGNVAAYQGFARVKKTAAA